MNRGNLIRPLLRRALTATEKGVCKSHRSRAACEQRLGPIGISRVLPSIKISVPHMTFR
jgi:hypothetical protein